MSFMNVFFFAIVIAIAIAIALCVYSLLLLQNPFFFFFTFSADKPDMVHVSSTPLVGFLPSERCVCCAHACLCVICLDFKKWREEGGSIKL